MKLDKLCIWLLLIGGIILLVPGIYDWLAGITNGKPWIPIFVGLLSVVTAITMFLKKSK